MLAQTAAFPRLISLGLYYYANNPVMWIHHCYLCLLAIILLPTYAFCKVVKDAEHQSPYYTMRFKTCVGSENARQSALGTLESD